MYYNKIDDFYRIELLHMLHNHLDRITEQNEKTIITRCIEYLDIRSAMKDNIRSRHEVTFSVWCLNSKENTILLTKKEHIPFLVPQTLNINFNNSASLHEELSHSLAYFGNWEPQAICDVGSYYLALDEESDDESDSTDRLCFDIRFLVKREDSALDGEWVDIAQFSKKSAHTSLKLPEQLFAFEENAA